MISFTPFTAKDRTRSGDSMDGWRRCVLDADDDFMTAIAPFPDNHRFQLGSSGIQIWGGQRKAAPRSNNGPRTKMNAPNRRRGLSQARPRSTSTLRRPQSSRGHVSRRDKSRRDTHRGENRRSRDSYRHPSSKKSDARSTSRRPRPQATASRSASRTQRNDRHHQEDPPRGTEEKKERRKDGRDRKRSNFEYSSSADEAMQ